MTVISLIWSSRLCRTQDLGKDLNDNTETPDNSQHEDTGSQRYLGEASDIRFYNAVKQSLFPQPGNETDQPNNLTSRDCSYEQDKSSTRPRKCNLSMIIPSRATAEKYIHVYFTTIHIAYPFVPRVAFDEAHNEWWQSEPYQKLSDTWTSLLCKFVESEEIM